MTRFLLLLFLAAFLGCSHSAPTETNITNERICNSCHNLVDFSKKLVGANGYEQTKGSLTKWCLDSGKGANMRVCSFLIKDMMVALDRIASDYFCERIKACDDESPVFYMAPNADNTSCDFCVNVMTHIKAIVTDPTTEAEFKQQVAQACTYVRSFKDECVQLVDENLDNVFEYLKKVLDPQMVCEQSGYCIKDFDAMPRPFVADIAGVINLGPVEQPAAVDEIIPFVELKTATQVESIPALPTPSNNLECTICKQVAQWALLKLKDNKTDDAIKEALDQVCDKIFSKGQRSQCENFVAQYTDEIISILKQEDDPNLICSLLGVCQAVEKTNSVPKTDAETQENGIVCDYCLKAATWLNDRIQDNRTTECIITALDQVCKVIVPKDKVTDCEEYIRAKLEDILACLQAGDDPNALCSTLKLCPPSETATAIIESDIIVDALPAQSKVTFFPSCLVCKRMMRWVHEQIEGNTTDAAIEDALSRICPVFSHHHKVDECEAAIQKWIPRIVLAFKQATEPELACELLMVCMQTEVAVDTEREVEATPIQNFKNCLECKTFARLIQSELKKTDKEREIDNWVIANVCEKVSNVEVKQSCEAYVEKYGEQVLQMIAMKAFDPKTLCEKELKMCPASIYAEVDAIESSVTEGNVPDDNSKIEFELLRPSKQEMCDMCVNTVKSLDGLLTSDIVEHELTLVAAKACNHLDTKKKNQCIAIVEAYGPYFLQMIGRLNNPNQVCKAVDMCYNSGEGHMLGGHKCTFGPTYWCHTSAHAEACKAADYCKRKVWAAVQ